MGGKPGTPVGFGAKWREKTCICFSSLTPWRHHIPCVNMGGLERETQQLRMDQELKRDLSGVCTHHMGENRRPGRQGVLQEHRISNPSPTPSYFIMSKTPHLLRPPTTHLSNGDEHQRHFSPKWNYEKLLLRRRLQP